MGPVGKSHPIRWTIFLVNKPSQGVMWVTRWQHVHLACLQLRVSSLAAPNYKTEQNNAGLEVSLWKHVTRDYKPSPQTSRSVASHTGLTPFRSNAAAGWGKLFASFGTPAQDMCRSLAQMGWMLPKQLLSPPGLST